MDYYYLLSRRRGKIVKYYQWWKWERWEYACDNQQYELPIQLNWLKRDWGKVDTWSFNDQFNDNNNK